jgi:predicted nucleic acid-binding Zn ribbon protein
LKEGFDHRPRVKALSPCLSRFFPLDSKTMPLYVYQGLNTAETFEIEQRISEPALTHNPTTGEPVKRLIGRPAIAFKGSGFYANDSKSGSNGGSSKNSNTDSSTKSDASAGDTKTEKTADTSPKPASDSSSAKSSESSSSSTSSSTTTSSDK